MDRTATAFAGTAIALAVELECPELDPRVGCGDEVDPEQPDRFSLDLARGTVRLPKLGAPADLGAALAELLTGRRVTAKVGGGAGEVASAAFARDPSRMAPSARREAALVTNADATLQADEYFGAVAERPQASTYAMLRSTRLPPRGTGGGSGFGGGGGGGDDDGGGGGGDDGGGDDGSGDGGDGGVVFRIGEMEPYRETRDVATSPYHGKQTAGMPGGRLTFVRQGASGAISLMLVRAHGLTLLIRGCRLEAAAPASASAAGAGLPSPPPPAAPLSPPEAQWLS